MNLNQARKLRVEVQVIGIIIEGLIEVGHRTVLKLRLFQELFLYSSCSGFLLFFRTARLTYVTVRYCFCTNFHLETVTVTSQKRLSAAEDNCSLLMLIRNRMILQIKFKLLSSRCQVKMFNAREITYVMTPSEVALVFITTTC